MFRAMKPAAIVLMISLLATIAGWRYQASQIDFLAEQRFDHIAERLKDEIVSAMTANGQALRGGAALLHAAGRVTRHEWQRYVAKLELPETFPGIQGMAYATVLRTPEERVEHERAVRAEGWADYAVQPKGDRPFMAVIAFIGPLDVRYQGAVGTDLFAEPVRRQAMERARDTGEPALSGKVTLLRAQPGAGVVLYLPVYASDQPIGTPQQRQEAVKGFVISPFSVDDFVQRVLEQGGRFDTELATFEIFDGVTPTQEASLYGKTGQHIGQRVPRHARSETLDLFGRRWTLRFASTPAFEADVASKSPMAVLLAGLVVSALLSGLVLSMTQRQMQAVEAQHQLREISERKRAEEALYHSTERLGLFIEHAPAAIAMFDRDMRYIAVSHRWQQDFNLAGTPLGRNHYEVFPEVGETWKAVHRRCLAGAVERSEGERFERADGSLQWIRWEVRPWRQSDGGIGGILISSEDITERKRVEEQLTDSLRVMQLAAEAGGMGSWHLDVARNRLDYSEQMLHILGIPPGQWAGTPEALEAIVHPDDIEHRRRARAAALANGGRMELEFRIRRPDGEIRWMHSRGSVLRSPDGSAAESAGIMIDITERRRAEEQIRFVMRELSHRTKNLLAVVQAMAWQSSQATPNLEEFLERFTLRIEGLRRSHDLLVKREWAGADLEDLVRGQLSPFLDNAASRLSVSGPQLVVRPSGAEDLGLILHELATNAMKYGALSVPGGKIAIDWDINTGENGLLMFRMCWQERGGPAVVAPTRSGFGSTVIKDMLATTKKARICMDFNPSGLIWRLEVVAQRMIDDMRPDVNAANKRTGSEERGAGRP